jgi:hypothetical protein
MVCQNLIFFLIFQSPGEYNVLCFPRRCNLWFMWRSWCLQCGLSMRLKCSRVGLVSDFVPAAWFPMDGHWISAQRAASDSSQVCPVFNINTAPFGMAQAQTIPILFFESSRFCLLSAHAGRRPPAHELPRPLHVTSFGTSYTHT